ncbi:ATP-binding cassette domain-containing protein, partial [Nostoc sp. NIES-2111]
MSERPLLRVANVGKDFNLGSASRRFGFSSAGAGAFLRMADDLLVPRFVRRGRGGQDEQLFQALRDVSFDVQRGEVLGVVGRNGAGKTTLLKILARVMQPSRGRVESVGRTVPLLELGKGFAPDLSVLKNIRLFGLMCGVPAAEVDGVTERILSVARLGPLRDVPLGDCPSGSFVQLSFAATLCFRTAVLLADELLAVGDSEYRDATEAR